MPKGFQRTNPQIPWFAGKATGAEAGQPGAWEPPKAIPPDTIDELNATVPDPATAWTPGYYVPSATLGAAYWTGSAWVIYTATAGTPGSYNVAGFVPQSAAVLATMAVKASPSANWTVGQRVPTGDTQSAHWNGSAWVTGAHP